MATPPPPALPSKGPPEPPAPAAPLPSPDDPRRQPPSLPYWEDSPPLAALGVALDELLTEMLVASTLPAPVWA